MTAVINNVEVSMVDGETVPLTSGLMVPAPRAGIVKPIVMHQWEKDEHQWYVEPIWVDEAIFATEPFTGHIHDPCCGGGRIVRAARAAGYTATGTDIVRRSPECDVEVDFLTLSNDIENVVFNPPFGELAEACIRHAIDITRRKVVAILPQGWRSGEKRSRWLETTPLRRVLDIVPRPSMPPGKLVEQGMKAEGGKVNYSLYVWHVGYDGRPEAGWLRKPAVRVVA